MNIIIAEMCFASLFGAAGLNGGMKWMYFDFLSVCGAF